MKTIILDFDGTIADTQNVIQTTIADTLEQLNLPAVDENEIRRVIGLPLWEMFVKTAGITDDGMIKRCVETYRACFMSHCEGNVHLYPGVADTLGKLKQSGITLAIATSRGRDSLVPMLQSLGISHLIDMIVAVEDVEHAKPAPDMVLKILAATGTAKAETMIVGDTTFDIGMGKSAGCATCGVTYGNHSREQLLTASPDYIADSFSFLEGFLL